MPGMDGFGGRNPFQFDWLYEQLRMTQLEDPAILNCMSRCVEAKVTS